MEYKSFARTLRKDMTEAEKELWYRIRNKKLGVKFRRQQPIGEHIVDFVCFEIEIEGRGHLEKRRDRIRDRWFEKQGYTILRFWNNEVLKNPEGVLEVIRKRLLSREGYLRITLHPKA